MLFPWRATGSKISASLGLIWEMSVDSMKWRIAKQLPRSYGDRTAVEVSGRVERPISDSAPEWMKAAIDKAAQPTPKVQQEESSVEIPKTMH